ncbi:MAG: DNA-3-methyladenine glycosylase I [Nitrospirae bacterium]|nr:DNA-3-methyladenine glycosylase I [Nitrospirota bacterium]
MSKVIFRSGLNWKMIENKWPHFRKAFEKFSIRKVARFDETDIDRLMQEDGIVRNYRKIAATVDNARTMSAIQREYGSFANWLDETRKGGEDALCRALGKQFSFMGESTAFFFLRCVGEEMPETVRRWEGKILKGFF